MALQYKSHFHHNLAHALNVRAQKCNKTITDKIFKFQKRALRLINEKLSL